ncbi:MAG TPA: hypothetical protein VGF94_16855 [Kofleriaceae bacterium]
MFVALWLALTACQPAPSLSSPSAPPDVRSACALAERRCTQCHDRGRILDAHFSRDEWASTIERMRQMPGSTIAPYETDTILHCLLSRSIEAR